MERGPNFSEGVHHVSGRPFSGPPPRFWVPIYPCAFPLLRFAIQSPRSDTVLEPEVLPTTPTPSSGAGCELKVGKLESKGSKATLIENL